MCIRNEDPRPYLKRDSELINLNGKWDFDFDDENLGHKEKWFLDHSYSKSIEVPFPFQSKLSGINDTKFHDYMRYHRSFDVSFDANKKYIIIGIAFAAIFIRGISEREEATKRFTPIGGVTKPTARFTTIITPKCIGSMPISVTIGSNIGVRINIAGVVSITIPTISRNILITSNSTIGFVKWVSIQSLTA